jgi:peptide/nickel transport system substrate-binding protein
MVLAACGTPETTVVEKTVEVEVPGETIVETVEVEVPGETVVETVVVEVTPTPQPTTRTGGWLDSITMVQIAPDAVVTQLQADEIDIYASALGRATDFKSAQDAGLTTSQNVGGSYELTFNPVGPVFEPTGELNPFSVPAIREAMNMLVDRNYIVQEIYGGLALPRTLPIVGAFPDYATFVTKARELESKYAYNLDKAKELITAEMEKLGATVGADGKFAFNGAPVTIHFIIRSDGDGTRKPVGDYVSNQLETIGFVVDRQYKTSPEASPIWIRGNPLMVSGTSTPVAGSPLRSTAIRAITSCSTIPRRALMASAPCGRPIPPDRNLMTACRNLTATSSIPWMSAPPSSPPASTRHC